MSTDGPPAPRRRHWSLTPRAFDRLLAALDSDRDRAAAAYEQVRYRLIGLLRWWGATQPEDLADETLDRVARKLDDGAEIGAGSIGAYVRGVARMVYYEWTREPRGEPGDALNREPAAPFHDDEVEASSHCLEECLASLAAPDRALLLRYYEGGKSADIRKHLADELAISTTGIDADVTPNFTIGVSGGELFPRLQLDELDDHGNARMLQAGGYGRLHHGGSRLDGVFSLGTQRQTMWRTVTDGLVAPGAKAGYGGHSVSSQLEYGYSFALGNGLTIEPQGGVQYGRVSFDGTTEDGVDALGLIVPARHASSRRTLAGAKVNKALAVSPAQLTVEGRASWAHEFSALGDIRMRFVGDSVTDGFSVAAPDQLRNSAVLGFSIAGNTGRLRLFANIDTEISGPTTGWSGSIGLNRSW
jgi:DNA-directed RNA polymerase specialized sigma24 family protein